MQTAMKSVRCPLPGCGHEHLVEAAAPAPTNLTGNKTYFWPKLVCQKCKKPFEYDGDPRQTRARQPG